MHNLVAVCKINSLEGLIQTEHFSKPDLCFNYTATNYKRPCSFSPPPCKSLMGGGGAYSSPILRQVWFLQAVLPDFKIVLIKRFLAYLDQAYSSEHTLHLSKKNSNVSNKNYILTDLFLSSERTNEAFWEGILLHLCKLVLEPAIPVTLFNISVTVSWYDDNSFLAHFGKEQW